MISTYAVLVLLRVALIFGSILFLYQYSWTLFAAMMTSGSYLVRQWDAYYAALAPTLYTMFCIVTGFGWLRGKALTWLGAVAHLLAAPSVFVSFLNMGYYLLFLAPLWLAVYWLSGSTPQTPNSTLNSDARPKAPRAG